MARTQDTMASLVALCKKRGFVFQSSEIYGGLGSCWDYGPLGVELKRNVKDAWWRSMVTRRRDIVGLDASILMHPKVWKSSGHLDGFSDPMCDCRLTQKRFRADQIDPVSGTVFRFIGASDKNSDKTVELEYSVLAQTKADHDKARKTAREFYQTRGIEKAELLGETTEEVENVTSFNPENGGELTAPREFNLMFKTFMGPTEDSSATVYMRPETAQGIFVNFVNVQTATRHKLPFGIAQVGKSFRNEITPGNFIFRTREFEQMEMEFFVMPGEDEKWYEYWRDTRLQWYVDHGIRQEKLRLDEHKPEALAHYAKACVDVEYEYPFGWGELEGIANRTDFDLKAHSAGSGKHLTYFNEETKEHVTPYVIEPAAGADRATFAFLCDAYRVEGEGKDKRTVMAFHPRLAPIKASVLPLVKRDGMPEMAEKIYDGLIDNSIRSDFEVNSSIGRRYARADEAGTPFCITVDSESLENNTVTIRERDSKEQYRVPADTVVQTISEKLK